MASDIYITVQDLKNATVIQNNIEAKLLAPYIGIAQDIHLDKLMGKALADVLKADLDLDTVTDTIIANTARFITLLPYVKDAMYYCVAAEASTFLSVRFTNKGINQRFSDFTSTAPQELVKDVKAQFRNYSEHYKKELICFIENNEADYPEYRNNNCDEDCLNTNFKYFSGFQFDSPKINKNLLE